MLSGSKLILQFSYHSKNKKMLLNTFEVVHFKKDDKLKGRDFYFDVI